MGGVRVVLVMMVTVGRAVGLPTVTFAHRLRWVWHIRTPGTPGARKSGEFVYLVTI